MTAARLLLAWVAVAALPANAAPALLELADGHFVRGQMRAIHDGRMFWQHDASGTEMALPLAEVRRVVFSVDTAPDPTGDLMLLRDGGLVAGSLESLDAASATLRTSFGATLRIPRPQVDSARLSMAVARPVIDGFPPLDRWVVPGENKRRPIAWTLDGGILRFSGQQPETIRLSQEIPAAVDLRFEMAWDPDTQRQPQFNLAVCADETKDGDLSDSDHYMLNFSRSVLFIHRMGTEEGRRSQQTIGRVQLGQFLNGRNSLRVRLVVNRPARKLHLFLNGQPAGPEEMRDKSDQAPAGKAILFNGFMQCPLRFRNLTVQPWSGLLGSSLAPGLVRGDQDQIDMVDGDCYAGKIVRVGNDPKGERMVEMNTPLLKSSTVLSLPVRFIRHLVFAKGEAAPPAAADGWAANVRLRDGSRLSGAIRGCADGRMAFFFGSNELSLPLASLVEIVPAGGAAAADKAQEGTVEFDEEEEGI